MSQNKIAFKAAVASILTAAALSAPTVAQAAEGTEKGHCVGANACKGHGGCKQVGKNECAGKNGCKGKGFLEKTKAECDELAKKDKKVHFAAAK